jgi:hypothetical protein
MSLLAMSTDLQDRDLTGRKRSHTDFLNQEACGSVAFGESARIKEEESLSDSEYQLSPPLNLRIYLTAYVVRCVYRRE